MFLRVPNSTIIVTIAYGFFLIFPEIASLHLSYPRLLHGRLELRRGLLTSGFLTIPPQLLS